MVQILASVWYQQLYWGVTHIPYNSPFKANRWVLLYLQIPATIITISFRTFFFTSEINLGVFPSGPGVKTPPSNAEGEGSIAGQGTKVPHAVKCKKIKKKFLFKSCIRELLIYDLPFPSLPPFHPQPKHHQSTLYFHRFAYYGHFL